MLFISPDERTLEKILNQRNAYCVLQNTHILKMEEDTFKKMLKSKRFAFVIIFPLLVIDIFCCWLLINDLALIFFPNLLSKLFCSYSSPLPQYDSRWWRCLWLLILILYVYSFSTVNIGLDESFSALPFLTCVVDISLFFSN